MLPRPQVKHLAYGLMTYKLERQVETLRAKRARLLESFCVPGGSVRRREAKLMVTVEPLSTRIEAIQQQIINAQVREEIQRGV